MKNADLLIVSGHVIEISSCGTFCFRGCQYLWELDSTDPTCRMPERDKVKLKVENGCIFRSDFCLENEKKDNKLKPICPRCKRNFGGHCLGLEEDIETDVIACEFFRERKAL